MMALLRSDLWRAVGPARGRGWLWVPLACMVVFSALEVALMCVLGTRAYDALASSTTAAAVLASPTALWSESFAGGGVLALVATVTCVMVVRADLDHGFARTLLASRADRGACLAEKVVLAGIVSAVLVAAGALASLAPALACGLPIGAEDPLAALGWLGRIWLATWALCAVCVLAAWTPLPTVGRYLVCLLVSMGVLPMLLVGLAHSSGGILRVLEPLAPALTELARWLPSAVYLATGRAAGWAAPELGPIVSALWVAASIAACALLGPRRDRA